MDAGDLRREIADELENNLLPFWRERCFDPDRGFVAEMASDGTVCEGAPLGLVLHARLLWTFSALSRRFADPRDLDLARHALGVLESRFHDREHGGYFWQVDASGSPADRTKKIYGQAFCLYALSEHHLATDDQAALDAALRLFELVEIHAWDPESRGYIEARAADWSEASDLRLSDKDMNVARSMNTHLHLLEAYTNVLSATIDPRIVMRLNELVGIFGRHIIRRDPCGSHLDHFFDESWNPESDTRTYGHDIESAWLLCEAAAALGGEELRDNARRWSIELARSALAEGLDADGALAYAGRGGEVVNADRDWWCQAEAVVGFWHAFELTRDPEFADAAFGVWNFIKRSVVDRVHGEWFWRVRSDGTIDENEPKVSEWKGPYHSVRMCLEMLRRLDDGDTGGAA